MYLRPLRRERIFGAAAIPLPASTCLKCASLSEGSKRLFWPRSFKHVVIGVRNVPGRDCNVPNRVWFGFGFSALVRCKYISKKRAPLLSTRYLKCTYKSGRGKLFFLGGPPPARFCILLPYERAESVSLGPGQLSSPSTAFEMHQVAFEMHEVVFEMHLREPGSRWNFRRGRLLHQHASAMYLCMTGRKVFLLAPGSAVFLSIAF